MTRWAQEQRAVTVAALRDVGADAATACDGWSAADLAAHLYVRERRPDAAPGVVVAGPLGRHTERVMASVLRVHSFDHVVQRVAEGPPLALRPFDEVMNLFEFFVHAEDVRRVNGHGPRELPSELEQLMWRRLRSSARVMFRRARGIQVELVAEHGERMVFGSGPRARLLAPVGELVLYAFNRKDIAEVTVTGDAEALTRLANTALGP